MEFGVTVRFATVATSLLAFFALFLTGDGLFGAGPRAWQELDVVPMPKEIRRTDRDVSMLPDEVTLVLGARKCRQSEIGAEWINNRVRALGGRPLRILSENDHVDTPLAMVIGTR